MSRVDARRRGVRKAPADQLERYMDLCSNGMTSPHSMPTVIPAAHALAHERLRHVRLTIPTRAPAIPARVFNLSVAHRLHRWTLYAPPWAKRGLCVSCPVMGILVGILRRVHPTQGEPVVAEDRYTRNLPGGQAHSQSNIVTHFQSVPDAAHLGVAPVHATSAVLNILGHVPPNPNRSKPTACTYRETDT